MKSVKPGRGPSMMSVITGIAAVAFGIFWTAMAVAGGVGIMAPFGIIFIIIAVVNVIYNYKNATGKNRYSQFDITDENEEPDPLNERFGGYARTERTEPRDGDAFCPYCGAATQRDFEFCPKCGKKLP